MKRIHLIRSILAVMATSFLLCACSTDNDSPSECEVLAISTINTSHPEGKEFHFTLDNGKKMFAGDTKAVGDYTWTDGQRAFVIFDHLDQKTEGYDYTIQVKRIIDILTADMVTIGKEGWTEEKLGDDKINTTDIWFTNDLKYLTIEYQHYGTHSQTQKHAFNLAINLAHPAPTSEDEYLNVEFRHNDQGDAQGRLDEGYVSFKLDKIRELIAGKKGLRIRVNTLYNDVKYHTVNFPTAM